MPRSLRRHAALIATLAAGGSLLAAPVALANGTATSRLSYEAVATSEGDAAAAPTSTAVPVPSAPAGISGGPTASVEPVDMTSDGSSDAAQPSAAGAQEAPVPSTDQARDQANFYPGGQGQSGAQFHDTPGERHAFIAPYIEAQQVVDTEISPQSSSPTYTTISAGIDGSLNGRNTQASLSLLYQHEFGEGGGAASANLVSGVGRVSAAVVPGLLQIDAAGYAERTTVLANGAALPDISTSNNALTQIYSVVGGPTLSTSAGDLKLDAHYHIGYTHVGTPGDIGEADGQLPADIIDHSTVQDAGARVGTRPGGLDLPVGLAVEGGYYQEDVSELAQRIRDEHVRGEVTIPVANDLALVGGLGYEDVQVSSRNAVFDANGNPVYNGNGELETNNAGPRYIAFDTSGLIWDVGAIWRPSPRTSLEVHVGRRYGDIGGYGLFSWHPTSRTALNIAVYNNMAGFGGELDTSLINLSTQFQTVRNALTGNISPCVGSTQGGACLTGALGAVNSTIFRARGVSSSYNVDFGRTQVGLGAGYDRREYIGAAGTVLAVENGEVDQDYWLDAYVTYALDRASSLSGTLNAYWFRTGLALNGDLKAAGATLVYQRRIARNLSASAALGIDSINAQALDDVWSASGELGVRYTF